MIRMKLSQGVGQVYKLSGSRRNPYIVRKTVGFIESKGKKKQIIKTIGYARTYQDGFLMLMKYNSEVAKNPNQSSMVLIPNVKLKFREIYDMWTKDFFPTSTKATISGYNATYKAFSSIHNKVFASLKTKDYEAVIAESDKNCETIRKMKFLINMLYKFALKHEYVSKNYDELVDISKYSNKNLIKEMERSFLKMILRRYGQCLNLTARPLH